jgi:lactoylglutathione lyase
LLYRREASGPRGPRAVDIELMRAFYEKYFDAQSTQKYGNERKRFTFVFPDISWRLAAGIDAPTRHPKAVDALTKRLQGDGFPLLDGPRRTGDGYYESMVADPEGNRIVIAE